jgi:hypothetical protein
LSLNGGHFVALMVSLRWKYATRLMCGKKPKRDEDEEVPLVPKHLVPIVFYYNEKKVKYVDEGLENLTILLLGKKVTRY